MCTSLKQNEENKKKNKQAALKAQMDLEVARQSAPEQQKHNTSNEEAGQTFNSKRLMQ